MQIRPTARQTARIHTDAHTAWTNPARPASTSSTTANTTITTMISATARTPDAAPTNWRTEHALDVPARFVIVLR